MIGRFGGSEQCGEVPPGGLFTPRPRCCPGHSGGVNLGGLREAGWPDDGVGSRAGGPRESPEWEGSLGDVLGPPAGARGWRRSTVTLARETVIQNHGQPCAARTPVGDGCGGTPGSLSPRSTQGPAMGEETPPRRNQRGARALAGGPEGEGEVGTWGSRALGLSQTVVIRESFKL